MKQKQPFRGVLSPALTPFKWDLSPDRESFLGYCRWLLDEGANGLAVFGTTSEANSLSIAERTYLLEYLVENKIPNKALMPGTGASNIPEAVQLTKHALEAGVGGVLVLPPFYYKNTPEDGIFGFYAELIERVANPDLKLFLYHIPQMSGVAITPTLIARLLKAYGPIIAGLKDSSGIWGNITLLLQEFPDLALFPASEKFLVSALKLGAAGCISATANYQVANIRKLIDTPDGDARNSLDAEVARIRTVFEGYVLMPALKAAAAVLFKSKSWRTVRPPLVELSAEKRKELLTALGLQDID